MNKNFDFNSKKFFILLILVCLVFVIVVINAFMYLPDNDDVKDQVSRQRAKAVNQPVENVSEQEENASEQPVSEGAKNTLNIQLPKAGDDIELVEIEPPKGINDIKENETEQEDKITELSPEEKVLQAMDAAQNYRNKKQYIKALDEYQKVQTLTNDKNFIASSYEGISTLYAINKRYGTALSFAIKAYNMSPSTSREMLLARLYYKTGDIEKATQRINNILRREFADDRW